MVGGCWASVPGGVGLRRCSLSGARRWKLPGALQTQVHLCRVSLGGWPEQPASANRAQSGQATHTGSIAINFLLKERLFVAKTIYALSHRSQSAHMCTASLGISLTQANFFLGYL